MSPRYSCCVDLHLILRRHRQVLLGRRIGTGFADGMYGVPSGHLEDGEAVTAGLIREAAEETGVVVEAADLRFVHAMHHRTDEGRIALFFEAGKWTGDILNREPDKCAGWRWFDLCGLPDPVVTYLAEALRKIAEGIPYSERSWE
ncbi:MAG: NUDIX domain-containing protein [Gemmatimonadetes bacterium]|nr:NUDIX domain-containing protein [Candidatus Palauibacter australiensis]